MDETYWLCNLFLGLYAFFDLVTPRRWSLGKGIDWLGGSSILVGRSDDLAPSNTEVVFWVPLRLLCALGILLFFDNFSDFNYKPCGGGDESDCRDWPSDRRLYIGWMLCVVSRHWSDRFDTLFWTCNRRFGGGVLGYDGLDKWMKRGWETISGFRCVYPRALFISWHLW